MTDPTGVQGDATGTLREFLRTRDVLCPRCGYNLRGLGSDRCPECSFALALTLEGVKAAGRSLIAAIVGLAVGAGSGAVLFGCVLALSIWFGEAAPVRFFLLPAAVLVIGTPLAFALATRSGQARFARQSSVTRVALAVLAWCYPALAVLVYCLALVE